jgi:Ca2+-binding RTX toxin-like protein
MDFDQELSPSNFDEIIGDNSSETIEGEETSDDINGGGGSDSVNGGAGDDQIDGGKGDDQIEGGKGADTLEGGRGDDIFDGGKGDDQIEGGIGADILDGGKGDDVLNGGDGDDLLIGGSGADTYQLSRGDDTIRGYKGSDEIELSQELIDAGLSKSDITIEPTEIDGKEAALLSYTLDGRRYTTTVIGVKDADEISVQKTSINSRNVKGSDDTRNETKGTNNLDNSEHEGTKTWRDNGNNGDNNDFFKPGNNSDTITGGNKEDYIFGKKGNDVIDGGKGDDTLYGNPDNDTINGGDGADYIDGGDDDDVLNGGDGKDSFAASKGDDVIEDFTYGEDILIDNGTKTWDLDGKVNLDEETKSVEIKVLKNDKHEGTTTIYLANYEDFKKDIDASKEPEVPLGPLTVEGSNDNDRTDGENWANNEKIEGTESWSYGNSNSQKFQPKSNEVEIVNGKGGDDYIFTLGQNDTINGGSGNDSLFGNAGDDEIRGDDGDDLIHGNNDNDTLRGGVGKDNLSGGYGNDRVIGDEGNDQLYGNDDNDTLLGGEGSDILNGGEGNDELTGDGTGIESQKDKFKASPGKDTITDFFFGIDELISSNHYEWDGESIVLDSSKNSATINVLDKASGETVGTTVVTIENFDQFEEIFNNPNKNPDFGFPPSAASDPNTKLIYKSDGKDFEAIGGQEANTITVDQIAEFANYYYEDEDRYFSKGRSVKPNTAGSDNSYSIDGHGGDDTIKGGDNDDYLHGNVGDDKLDGGPGNDRLLGGTDNDTIEGGIGDDKLFGWSGEDSLIGGEGNDYLKAEDGADTLEGGEGEDTLNGGSGQDFLRGGKHADTYVLSFGNDTIKGYQKIDKITLSQEILDAGVDSNDIEIERTIIDEKEAAFLSFELKGIEHTTTVIGVNDAEYDYLQEDFDKTTETPNDELLTKLLTTTLGRSEDARTVVLPATTASYIDWGDGNIIQDPTSDDLTHTYDDQNQYTIQAVFDWDNSTGIGNWGETANKLSWLADVTQFGQKTYGDVSGSLLKSGRGAFAGFAGQSISALSELDTSNLSSTYRMFSGARLFNQDLGDNFLHAGINDAFSMFSDANVFNNGGEASIGQWNTSNVTYMRSMFDGAGLFNQDLSDWDTSAVRDPQNESGKGGMQDMFKNTPVFAADLSGWNVKDLSQDLNTDFNTSLGSKDQGVWPNFGGDPTPPSIDTPDDELLTKLLTTTLGRSKDARTVVLPATTASYIDWGDGNIIQDPTSDDLTHTYDDQNQYTIQAVFDWDNSTGIGNWGKLPTSFLGWLMSPNLAKKPTVMFQVRS